MYLKNLVFINSLEPAFSTEFPLATILRSFAAPEAVAAGGGGGGADTLVEGLFFPLDPLFFGGIFDVNLRINLRICKQDPHHNSACLSVPFGFSSLPHIFVIDLLAAYYTYTYIQ